MEFHVYSIALTTRFRGIDVREGVIFQGPGGWAEFSPFADYDAIESSVWWRAAIDSAAYEWPTPLRESIPVNVTVPAVTPDKAIDIVNNGSGCRTAKVKVGEPGQDLNDDLNRVAAVRDALGDGGKIRVDVNGAWTVEEAIDAIGKLDRAAGGLEYVEQPVATIPDLARVRKSVNVLIAADESIRRVEDPYEVARVQAADIAVVKVQPLGGVYRALRIIEDIELPVVVSSALETSIGLSAGLALAAAVPDLPYACGLATTNLLTGDVVSEPLKPVNGEIAVSRPVADLMKLSEFAASDEIKNKWLDLIDAVRNPR